MDDKGRIGKRDLSRPCHRQNDIALVAEAKATKGRGTMRGSADVGRLGLQQEIVS